LIAGDVDEAMRELHEALKRYPDEKEALYSLGSMYRMKDQSDSAIVYLTQAIEVDPMYKTAFNLLAYTYDRVGDFDKALEAINRYIALAPDEANPYDSRGQICAYNGRLDEAIESYAKALEIRPDFHISQMYLAYMYLFRGNYAEAESLLYDFLAKSTGATLKAARFYLAQIPMRQGKFKQAIQILDDAIAADRLELAPGASTQSLSYKYVMKARIFVEQDSAARAVREFETFRQTYLPDSITFSAIHTEFYVQLLVENNESAKAEQVAAGLKQVLEETEQPLKRYYYAAGCVELGKKNYDAAISCFEQTEPERRDFAERFMLALTNFEAGHYTEAKAQFENLMIAYNSPRAYYGVWSVKMHYYLGRVCEELGQPEQAIAHYRRFIEIWKNADSGIASLDDAKVRLARLGGVS